MSDDARRWVSVHAHGHITDGELAIELAKLLGVNIRCQMGECPHSSGQGDVDHD